MMGQAQRTAGLVISGGQFVLCRLFSSSAAACVRADWVTPSHVLYLAPGTIRRLMGSMCHARWRLFGISWEATSHMLSCM